MNVWLPRFPDPRAPLSLETLDLPRGLRVLSFAPHPDDFDAVGVTMRLLHERGAVVSVAVLSGGASGVEDAFCTPSTAEAKARAREVEQRASCRFFGLPDDAVGFLRLDEQDGEPADTPANAHRVRAALDAAAPDMVVLPHGHDEKPGHRNAYALLRPAAAARARPLVAMLNRDPKTIAMRTDLYVPFGTDNARWKAELLRFHRSQHERNLRTRGRGFDERILDGNRAIARELGLAAEFAEAFEVEVLGAENPRDLMRTRIMDDHA